MKNARSVVLVLGMVGLMAGCRMAQMAVPADLKSGTTVYPVVGRQGFDWGETFTFGPYAVEHVKRGWVSSWKFSFIGFSAGAAKQKFEYALSVPGNRQWQCRCATGVRSKDLEGDVWGGVLSINLESDTLYTCAMKTPAGKEHWHLAMGQGTSDYVMNGGLAGPGATINVRGTRKLEGSPIELMDPTGYEFVQDGKIIGAVEVINNGRVWISDGLDDEVKDALATAAAALMLYKEIYKE